MVERLFLAVSGGCLQFVIVVFPDHTHLLFLYDRHTVIWFHTIAIRNANTTQHSIKVRAVTETKADFRERISFGNNNLDPSTF